LFVTHRLQDGNDIRTIEALLGHKDVTTTMIYTRALNQRGHRVRSQAEKRLASETNRR
jgi:site-specific recombinase XerD